MLPAAVLVLALGAQDAAPDTPSLELRVERAIARGVAWLRKEQRQDGTFPGQEGPHPGGETALAGLTLLKAGVPAGDVSVQACVRALEPVQWMSTYSTSVYLMFLEALRASSARTEVAPPAARACLDVLLAGQREGVWGYPADPLDMSNTQFALLGLRAAAKLGLEIPDRTLESAARALVRWQSPEGGFAYRPELEPTGGMTAAALGGFAILAELGASNARVKEALGKHRAELARAEAWLATRFDAGRNAYGERHWTRGFQLSFLWAVERWCGFTGRAEIGGHDWYRDGAAWLVDAQKPEGSWGSVDETCFALLFLRRATVTGWQDLRAVWERLDREKAEQAARPALACAPDVPRAVDWLLAGPFRDQRGAPALWDPPFDVARFELRERAKVGGEPLRRVALKPDGWTELETFAPEGRDRILWLLAARGSWESPDGAALPVRFWVQAEDGWRLFLDGRELAQSARVQSGIDEVEAGFAELAPGDHRVTVLVSDVLGVSAFGFRASRPDGGPLPAGFTLTAEARPKRGPR